MENKVFKYLTFIEPKAPSSISFYDNLNESNIYNTESYKWAYKDINLENFDTKYTNIFYNSISKFLYGESGKPEEPKFGPGYEQSKSKIDKTKKLFSIIWNNTKIAIDKLLQDNKTNFPKSIVEEISSLEYNLPKDFTSSDYVYDRLKNNNLEGFPEALKSKINKIQINPNVLKNYSIGVYTSVTDSNKESFNKNLSTELPNAKNVLEELKKNYFPNLQKYSSFENEMKDIFSELYVDCYLYTLSNSIFNSKKGSSDISKKQDDKADVKKTSTRKSSGVAKREQPSSKQLSKDDWNNILKKRGIL